MRACLLLCIVAIVCNFGAGKQIQSLREAPFKNPAALLHQEHVLDLEILAEVPTMEPSQEPTAAPSPSVVPTVAPSLEPTAQPTYVPTLFPSFAPSKQTVPILSFDTSVTMGGVTTNTLDTNGQKAVVNATASSMGVSQNDVTYKGSVATAESRRRLSSGISLFTTTYKIVSTTGVKVLVTSGSSQDLYTALTTAIETAVATGQFTTNLQKASIVFNSPALANANVTAVATFNPVTDNPSSRSSDDPVLDDGAIAGIVIGGFFFLVIVAALIYLYFTKADTSKVKVSDAETEMLNVQP